jgi:hypothetical protein
LSKLGILWEIPDRQNLVAVYLLLSIFLSSGKAAGMSFLPHKIISFLRVRGKPFKWGEAV